MIIARYLKPIIRRYKLLIITIVSISSTMAEDFGVRGHVYKISEQAFLAMIEQRLQTIDMKKEQAKMTQIAKDRIENPAPIENIKPAIKNRIFYYDPTYRLDKDAILPCGKILHKAGTIINPLQHMDLNRRIFFIDTRKKNQVTWIKEQLRNPLPAQDGKIEDRIILIGGSPFKLKEEIGKDHEDKVYFDQAGELSSKFGIKSSPALVVQDALNLRIEEILLND